MAAISTNGALKTWGVSGAGGETCSSINIFLPRTTASLETGMRYGDVRYGYPASTQETWLKQYQCQIGEQNSDLQKTIIDQLLNSNVKILSLHKTKSAFVAINQNNRIVPWGNIHVGGKLTDYARNKEKFAWKKKEKPGSYQINKNIYTNAYSIFVIAEIDTDEAQSDLEKRNEWYSHNYNETGTNYMFWGKHNDMDKNVMFNIITGEYEVHVPSKNAYQNSSYYVNKVYATSERDVDAFLLEVYVGSSAEKRILIIGNTKYHKKINNVDEDTIWGNVQKIVGKYET